MTEISVTWSETPVKLTATSVKLTEIPGKLQGIPVKLTRIAVNLTDNLVKLLESAVDFGRVSIRIDTHLDPMHRDPCQIARDLYQSDRDLCQIDSVSEFKQEPLFILDKNRL